MWKNKIKLNSYVKNFPTGIGLTLYKGNFEKYKGKFANSIFCHFKLLNPFTNCLMVLICILEVLTDLFAPILPYLDIAYVEWHLRQIWHFWHFCHKWHSRHLTFVISRYGNMGVKTCVWTSGMQTNAIKQLVNRFNVLKFQNTDFQDFSLYFPKFPLYNEGTQWESFQWS